MIERDLIGYVEGECRSKAESVVGTQKNELLQRRGTSAEWREECRRRAEERGRGAAVVVVREAGV